MPLIKLLKTGSLVLGGALLGGLISYNSQKTEIVEGINDIKDMAIVYKTQVKELTTNKEQLESQIEELEASLDLVNEDIDKKNNQLQDVKNELIEVEEERNKLQEQLSSNSIKIDELDNTIVELNEKIKDLEARLESSESEILKLQEVKAEAESEINRLKEEIELSESNYRKMFSMWQTADILRVQADKKNKELEAELEALRTESKNVIDKANEQIREANQDQIDILDVINQAKEDIANN